MNEYIFFFCFFSPVLFLVESFLLFPVLFLVEYFLLFPVLFLVEFSVLFLVFPVQFLGFNFQDFFLVQFLDGRGRERERDSEPEEEYLVVDPRKIWKRDVIRDEDGR